jgi:hypothetical protein
MNSCGTGAEREPSEDWASADGGPAKMRNPPQLAAIKPVAVLINVRRDSSLSNEIFLLRGQARRILQIAKSCLQSNDCLMRVDLWM